MTVANNIVVNKNCYVYLHEMRCLFVLLVSEERIVPLIMYVVYVVNGKLGMDE